MSWHYLQGQEVESWEADSLDGAPSALLRLIPMPARSSSPASETASSSPSQSGMTFGPSTDQRGVATSTSSQVVSLARTSQSAGRAKESAVSVPAFGLSSQGSLARWNPSSSSWKTAPSLLPEGSTEFSGTWPQWGSMLNGECWAQTIPALHIAANESGSWPTPCKRDSRTLAGSQPPKRSPKSGLPLAWTIGKVISPENRKGGRLNPEWVEWLMGWPMGWTDLRPLETDRFLSWLRPRSESSEVA